MEEASIGKQPAGRTAKRVVAKKKVKTAAKRKEEFVIRRARAMRLRSLREKTRLTRQAFSRECRVPYGSMQNWEDPHYGGLTKTGAPRVVKALQREGIFCTVRWLLTGEGPEPYISASILVKNMRQRAFSSTARHLRTNADQEQIMRDSELELFSHHYQHVLHYIVGDADGMSSYVSGECVAGKVYSLRQAAQFIGTDCLAQTEQGQIFLGVLQSGDTQGTFNLQCGDNVMSGVKFQRVAPIVWRRRPV